jgi:hypothetical protein
MRAAAKDGAVAMDGGHRFHARVPRIGLASSRRFTVPRASTHPVSTERRGSHPTIERRPKLALTRSAIARARVAMGAQKTE